jgi:hypothetical protein
MNMLLILAAGLYISSNPQWRAFLRALPWWIFLPLVAGFWSPLAGWVLFIPLAALKSLHLIFTKGPRICKSAIKAVRGFWNAMRQGAQKRPERPFACSGMYPIFEIRNPDHISLPTQANAVR